MDEPVSNETGAIPEGDAGGPVFRLLDGSIRMASSRPEGCVTPEEFSRLLGQLGDVQRRRMVKQYTGAAVLKWADDYGMPVQSREAMASGRERRWINVEAGLHWFFNVKARKVSASRGGDRFARRSAKRTAAAREAALPLMDAAARTGDETSGGASDGATSGGVGGGMSGGVGGVSGAVAALKQRMQTGEGVTTAEAGALLNLVKAEREMLELDEKRAKLIPVEDVQEEWRSMMVAYRSAALALVTTAATRITATVEARVMAAGAEAGAAGERGVLGLEALRCEVEDVLRDEVDRMVSVLRGSADAEERSAA